MKSPVAPEVNLERTHLDDGLIVFRCPESDGYWITAECYWRWQKAEEVTGNNSAHSDLRHELSELDRQVKLCPETGTIMTRYRVGQGIDFRVDRSITGGVWLDSGEWEILKSGNLHRSLHLIFTEPWQKSIVAAEQEAAFKMRILERLGPEMIAQLDTIRNGLNSESDRAVALAYLHFEES